MNEMNKSIVIVVILLIIAILGFNTFVLYERYLYDHNNVNNNTNIDNTNTQNDTNNVVASIKENNDLEYVYDANYESDITDTYSINDVEYNINNYKVPYININSEYAKSINNNIKTLWNNSLDVFRNGISDGVSYIDTLEYEYSLNDNILSIVIKYGYGSTDVVSIQYVTYNINIDDGNEYSVSNALKKLNYDISSFRQKALDKIDSEYDKWCQDNNIEINSEVETLKNKTKEDFKVDNWYVLSNGNINLIVPIQVPIGTGSTNISIEIEK